MGPGGVISVLVEDKVGTPEERVCALILLNLAAILDLNGLLVERKTAIWSRTVGGTSVNVAGSSGSPVEEEEAMHRSPLRKQDVQ